MNFLKKLGKILNKIEEAILIVFTSALVLMAILQLVLTFIGHGVLWFDAVMKYLVLWTGMIAASITTTNNKHIKIDLVGVWTKGRIKTGLHVLINIFSTIICTILFVLSIIYLIKIKIPATDPAPFLNIPSWILILIVPIAFGMMSIKFIINTVKCIYFLIKNVPYPEEDVKQPTTTDTNDAS